MKKQAISGPDRPLTVQRRIASRRRTGRPWRSRRAISFGAWWQQPDWFV